MSVLIKGIDMPTGNHEIIIRIQSDGRVLDQRGHRLCLEPTAVPVPPHGRLIDADALYRRVKTECNPYGKPTINFDDGNKVMGMIEYAPTIIPAEEGE